MAEKKVRITEDRMIRIQVLDRCFSDRHNTYYIEDLVEACNKMLRDNGRAEVKKRAIWNDIWTMEGNSDWEVDLLDRPDNLEGGRRFFRYKDPHYSIFKNELSEEQVSQLKSMLIMLQQFKGLPQFAHLEEMMENLENKYRFELPNSEHIISFDTNEYVEGIEYLSEIFSAIVGRRTLCVTYKPFGKEERDQAIHPYYIKQYNNRWFLICKIDGYDRLTNMALDRMRGVKDCNVPYESSDIDFEDYFDDIIGVTMPEGDIEKVLLQFSEHRFPYVKAKPMHPSQRAHAEDRTIELEIKVNKELAQKILSYGSDVIVLAPETLKIQIRQELEKSLNNY